jgi:hypothetical protein
MNAIQPGQQGRVHGPTHRYATFQVAKVGLKPASPLEMPSPSMVGVQSVLVPSAVVERATQSAKS